MGIALQSLNSDAEEAETLRAQLTAGDRVIELDPAIVDRSPFRDRIGDEFDADFEKLKASVSEEPGQQVPGACPTASRAGGAVPSGVRASSVARRSSIGPSSEGDRAPA